MIKLDRPVQEAGDVFTTCISRVQNTQLKSRLEGVLQAVVDASAEFDDAATHTRLYQIVQQNMVGGIVTQKEMEAVYTQRMAKKGAPGRDVYDALFTSAPHGKCPLCGHRTVSTLDHHLPKAHYPALAVAPLNLVPACGDCNKSKLASLPTNACEEMLHPYFDDIDGDRWLYAEVIQSLPAALRFFVHAPAHWSPVLGSRVEGHFRTLGLGRLYSSEAADELLNIRHQLRMIHEGGGALLVKIELQGRAESCQNFRQNGWRTATYRALADSDWFCDRGFQS
jgi:5-methylcytosine-specific restriction endonuclease McrA